MLKALKNLFDDASAAPETLPRHERRHLQLAVASVLHEATRVDLDDSPEEHAAAERALVGLFGVSAAESAALLDEGRARAQRLTSYYAPISVIKRDFDLPQRVQDAVLNGSGGEKIKFIYAGERGNRYTREHAFEGVIPNLERRYRETDSIVVREELARYLSTRPCPECEGTRLRREARNVTVAGPAPRRFPVNASATRSCPGPYKPSSDALCAPSCSASHMAMKFSGGTLACVL